MASPIVEPILTTTKPATNDSRLFAGRRLRAAKIVWWLCLALVIVMTLVALPLNASLIRQPCTDDQCSSQQLSLEQAQTLTAAGISLGTWAVFLVLVN